MFLVALLILALGFYEQYSEASGVFAPDGFARKALVLAELLLEPATVVAAPTDGAEAASVSSLDEPDTNGLSPGALSAPAVSDNRFGFQGFDHCSPRRIHDGHCHLLTP
jgi:hypothetical protein